MPFKFKPTNPEPTPPTTFSVRLSQSGPLTNCPGHPKARYQITTDSPSAPEPVKLFYLAILKLLTLSCLVLSVETRIKGSCHSFHSPSTSRPSLGLTRVGSMAQHAPFSSSASVTNSFNNGCLLISWPCHI